MHPPRVPRASSACRAAWLGPSAWGSPAEVHVPDLLPMGSSTAMPRHPHGWEGGAWGNASVNGLREAFVDLNLHVVSPATSLLHQKNRIPQVLSLEPEEGPALWSHDSLWSAEQPGKEGTGLAVGLF